jgi:high-affinity K+ transport system ATPase subunit B
MSPFLSNAEETAVICSFLSAEGILCASTSFFDKTGTITLGNRKANAFIPVDGVSEQELADAAQLSSLADETPEGRSVVILAKEKFNIRGRELSDKNMTFIPFTGKPV